MPEERRPSGIRAYPSTNSGKRSEARVVTGRLCCRVTCPTTIRNWRASCSRFPGAQEARCSSTPAAAASSVGWPGIDHPAARPRPLAVVAGECSSAAIIPFAACRRRFVTPHSTLLFHPMRWQSEEDVRMEEAAEWARYFKILEEDIDTLLTRMFPCDMSVIQNWTRPGRFVKDGTGRGRSGPDDRPVRGRSVVSGQSFSWPLMIRWVSSHFESSSLAYSSAVNSLARVSNR